MQVKSLGTCQKIKQIQNDKLAGLKVLGPISYVHVTGLYTQQPGSSDLDFLVETGLKSD